MKPRGYQNLSIEGNMQALCEGVRSTLTGLFTGAGKTVIFCHLAKRVHEEFSGRTLIIPPLREVVWQTVDKVRQVVGMDPGLEMGEFRVQQDEFWNPEVVVACKQTLIRGRYKKFDDIKLVVVDEAHLSFSPACLEMFRWFNERGAMVAGYTATPFRQDGTEMMSYYERVISSLDLQWAIDNGWAVPPKCKIARVEGLDLSGVLVQGGDFNQTQLQAAVEKEANLHRIALIAKEEMLGPTVVFTPSVASAKGVCHYLNNNYGIPAAFVSGSQPEDERKQNIRDFKSGKAKILVNCAVVATGFDFPPIRSLILGRPTRSRTFWLQVAGRAVRPLGGVVDDCEDNAIARQFAIAASEKPDFRIVDCTDASLDHRLVTAVDMFCTGPKEVVNVVKGACEKAPLSPEEMDALAQQELERRLAAQEIEKRRLAMQGMAGGRVVGEEFRLGDDGKRCVGTYMNPLKGKYAGLKMSQLPDYYIDWACRLPTLSPWIKSTFKKERKRRGRLVAG
jgi:superfamily II DNA or RNA helicase